jgi:hypothetical protein
MAPTAKRKGRAWQRRESVTDDARPVALRLKQFMNNLGEPTLRAMADATGLQWSTLDRIFQKEDWAWGADTLNAILATYPDLDLVWLFTGHESGVANDIRRMSLKFFGLALEDIARQVESGEDVSQAVQSVAALYPTHIAQ